MLSTLPKHRAKPQTQNSQIQSRIYFSLILLKDVVTYIHSLHIW